MSNTQIFANTVAAQDIVVRCMYLACCDEYIMDGSTITGGRIINQELFSKFERISDYLISQLY